MMTTTETHTLNHYGQVDGLKHESSIIMVATSDDAREGAGVDILVGDEEACVIDICTNESLVRGSLCHIDVDPEKVMEALNALIDLGQLVEKDGRWIHAVSVDDAVALGRMIRSAKFRMDGTSFPSVKIPGGMPLSNYRTGTAETQKVRTVRVFDVNRGSFDWWNMLWAGPQIVWPGSGGYWSTGLLTPEALDMIKDSLEDS